MGCVVVVWRVIATHSAFGPLGGSQQDSASPIPDHLTNLDLDLNGLDGLEDELERLKEQGEGDAVYVTGTNVEYAVYLEFGTEDMPPYPFFRPAIREFKANPEALILENTRYASLEEIPSANALVEAAANALAEQMATNATATSPGRSAGTDPDHPKRQSGNLAADISAERIK